MNKHTLLLFLLLFPIVNLSAKESNLTHLSVKDGLLSSTVYYAMQDSKGFIWFCTETGVERYDGRTFDKFTINSGLADNENFKCFEDSRNRIWFLSYNGKLSYFYQGSIHNDQNTPWLSYPYSGTFLLDFIEDKNGSIWISTSSGDVLLIKNNTVSVAPAPFRQRQYNYSYIAASLFYDNDSIKKLVETHETKAGEIYKFNLFNRKIIYLGNRSELLHKAKAEDFNAAFSDTSGHLFLAENTLANYDLKHGFSVLDTKKFGITSKLLSFLSVGEDFWLGTAGEGAYLINRSGLVSGKEEMHILPGMNITCILKDDEGNIWFTTHGDGVFILKNNTRSITTIATGMTYSIGVVHSKKNKYIITGNDKGTLNLITGDSIFKSFHISNQKFNRIRDIFALSDTQILIGTDQNIIYKYNILTDEYKPIGDRQGYKNGYFSTDGFFWACTQDNVYKLEQGYLKPKLNTAQLGKYTSLYAVSDSVYYIGTTDLLYKLACNGKEIKIILDRPTLKTGVTDLKFVNGTLWVATRGNGIFMLKNDSVYRHINTENTGIVSDVCQKLYDDQQQYIWVICSQGISVLNRTTGSFFCNLSSNTGLNSDDIKNITSDSEQIYVVTAEGTNIFKLKDIINRSCAPKVYVTSFKKGNESTIDPDSLITFDYFKGFVNVYFTAITYQSPGDVQYEYKIGDNADWLHTRSTNISLFSLSPGTHKLLFRAKKYNSAWSIPIAFYIAVSPLWYQTIWFYTLMGICSFSLVYYFMRKGINDVHKRSQEQNMLHQKITELENKSLAYQMNPHFIFNSLNTVQQFMLVKEPEQGISYLNDFAMLMRKMLENSRQATIPLSEEIDFLKCYLHLEKIRFNNKFEYVIHVDEKLLEDEITIPPILFQPLLENAIKHGIAPLGAGRVELTIIKAGDFLTGTVEDNGIGINAAGNEPNDVEDKKGSTALKVLEERLRLIKNQKGQNGSMAIRDKKKFNSAETGTIVEIRIPLIE